MMIHPINWACGYLSMLGLKSIHVNKKGPGDESHIAMGYPKHPFPWAQIW